jgi:UDP-glucuronate 4-epimerase
MKNVLITGSAGFIGYHLSKQLILNNKYSVYGIDNLNNYYDKKLKLDRLKDLKKHKNFNFKKIDLINMKVLSTLFKDQKFDIVINLAAQAGVRHSITNPDDYFNSNVIGFYNILKLSKQFKIEHLLFASTSSVYGNNKSLPLTEEDKSESPLSFYAATKKSNEVMAYSYSNIHNIPITALRFFTVFGPYGRPDMSLYKFTENGIKGKNINLFNNGNHSRDFTHIDDVVFSIVSLIDLKPIKKIPYEVYNICGNSPKKLKFFVNIIEKTLGKKIKKKFLPLQAGDVKDTHGDNNKLLKKIKVKKFKSLEKGIEEFVHWFKKYYKII